ncbi:hypothetical protein DFH11DRAFT_1776767 [Phellopilus nigrolimitatus]|nr:hypothetical protein DFH11DRAFT_1776767 [Phellopilus nigrolimitatus]
MTPSELRRPHLSSDIDPDAQNYTLFKDCLASRLLFSLTSPQTTSSGIFDSGLSDAEDLEDFTSYLASEVWPSLPESIRLLTYESSKASGKPDVDEIPLHALPLSLADNLISYSLIPLEETEIDTNVQSFVRKVLAAYLPLALTPPPVWSNTRVQECEICERDVPLTYHHLIPRSIHTREEMLGSVAWLCRPCHSVVHRVASNEDLARGYYTVERLLARDDIHRWRNYASKQRWGVHRG